MPPPKKYFILSLSCIAAAVITVLILMIISKNRDSRNSDFKRNFISKRLVSLYHSEKINGLRAICGIENNHIYFETDTVGYIIETDTTLSNKHLLKFEIPDKKIVQSLYSTFIDSSFCYIMAGNLPGIIRFNLHNPSRQFFHFPRNLFSQSVVACNSNFAIRAYQKTAGKWDQIFTMWKPVTKNFITEETISKKRGDAGFSKDGILLFDKATSNILYVAYYSDQFLCMDTLLHVLYKGQTIDTFPDAAIGVLTETSRYSATITNGTPLQVINLASKAVKGKLYIYSATRSDNESRRDFTSHAVIDIYQISDGHYFGSFYIPNYKEGRLKDFQVVADKVIVLYDNYIAMYSIPFIL